MCKLYAVIRYRIYQNIKLKTRANKSLNESNLTKDNSLAVDEDPDESMLNEDDIADCIREVSVEEISREVFKLYDVKIGLDAKLTLRKVQVREASDQMANQYMACIDQAHELFLQYILKGFKF